jgi:hypothetical protein
MGAAGAVESQVRDTLRHAHAPKSQLSSGTIPSHQRVYLSFLVARERSPLAAPEERGGLLGRLFVVFLCAYWQTYMMPSPPLVREPGVQPMPPRAA